jgi:hypothetical protein
MEASGIACGNLTVQGTNETPLVVMDWAKLIAIIGSCPESPIYVVLHSLSVSSRSPWISKRKPHQQ